MFAEDRNFGEGHHVLVPTITWNDVQRLYQDARAMP